MKQIVFGMWNIETNLGLKKLNNSTRSGTRNKNYFCFFSKGHFVHKLQLHLCPKPFTIFGILFFNITRQVVFRILPCICKTIFSTGKTSGSVQRYFFFLLSRKLHLLKGLFALPALYLRIFCAVLP